MRRIMSNPELNETSAACSPLSNRCESSPLARACKAIIAPDKAAKKSKRIVRGYQEKQKPGGTLVAHPALTLLVCYPLKTEFQSVTVNRQYCPPSTVALSTIVFLPEFVRTRSGREGVVAPLAVASTTVTPLYV